MSLWRICLPYLSVGIVFSGVVLALNELCVPDAQDKANSIMERHQPGSRDRNWRPLRFHNHAENRAWNANWFNLNTGELIKPSVISVMSDGSRRAIYAERGSYSNHVWTFYNVDEWTKSPQDLTEMQKSNTVLQVDFPETPQQFRSSMKIGSLSLIQAAKRPQLSIAETRSYLLQNPTAEPSVKSMLLTQLHGRIAEPAKCLIVVLMALPFSTRSGRRNVFVGVASSIFICFAYFILQRLCLTLGTGGLVAPALAAWLPNIAFGVTGIWLTTRVR